ncbi:hypothetical protein N2K95_10075 [Arthrobacter zhaoxinii]|uniref:Uncharacterized protein n=1 Tax=Arthrobacter zhaoxinii TaxID=2964616 RepID=A0ABY5YMJ7_9MICC|nr:hypothetical protein [Arthrobacter zhaoxinii]UWX96032.1 hypothetical protein N2K95_10075 [Arthrobacter zhaoxinii]
MGRHRAEPIKTSKPEVRRDAAPRPQGRSPELLAWGVFLTAVATAALLWAEAPRGAVAAGSGLLFLTFGLSWFFEPPRALPSGSADPMEATTTTAAVPASFLPVAPVFLPASPEPTAPSPGRAASAAEASPRAATAHAAARTRSEPHGRRAAAVPVFHEMPAEPSRWTRTFGPPETGQIPLQPYLNGVPASYATAGSESPERRQRSHSSH